MKSSVAALLVATLLVAGCQTVRESRFNPRNWFGSSQEEGRPDLGPTSDVVDNRPMVAEVSALAIERTSSGAIIRAEGLTPTAGWWDAELIPENNGRPRDGVITFRLVAAAPREPVPDTGVRSRTVVAVYPLSVAHLEVTSAIVVTGENNSRRARR